MSRVSRYHESFKTFINKRSCLSDIQDTDLYEPIKKHIDNNQFILPILMLTITNNQTKKNKVSFLGYYAATSVEFLRIYLELSNNRSTYIKEYGDDKYCRILNILIIWIIKSWNQNMEVVKRHLDDDKINKLYNSYIGLLYAKFTPDNLLGKNPTKINNVFKSDLHKYYLHKNDKDALDKFKNINQIDKESMNIMIDNKMGCLGELIVSIGWVLGCGNDSQLNRLAKAGKAFGIMYQLANDFNNIEQDLIKSQNNQTYNYVVNCGIQESYEKFMENKEKFIEEALNLDIFSSTVKEIVDLIEIKVDNVIDNTSPDLKSSYSTVK